MSGASMNGSVHKPSNKRLLVVLVAYYVGFAIVLAIPSGPILGIPWFVAAILAAYLVNKDAAKINGLTGRNSINGSLWAVLSLFLGFIALPLYIFVERNGALSAGAASLQNRSPSGAVAFCSNCGSPAVAGAAYCSSCGSRLNVGSPALLQPSQAPRQKPRYFDVIVMGALGVIEVMGGVLLLLNPPNLNGLNIHESPNGLVSPAQALTFGSYGVAVFGLILVAGAAVIYYRRRARYERQSSGVPLDERKPDYAMLFLVIVGVVLVGVGVIEFFGIGPFGLPVPVFAQNGTIIGHNPPPSAQADSRGGVELISIGLVTAVVVALVYTRLRPVTEIRPGSRQ